MRGGGVVGPSALRCQIVSSSPTAAFHRGFRNFIYYDVNNILEMNRRATSYPSLRT